MNILGKLYTFVHDNIFYLIKCFFDKLKYNNNFYVNDIIDNDITEDNNENINEKVQEKPNLNKPILEFLDDDID